MGRHVDVVEAGRVQAEDLALGVQVQIDALVLLDVVGKLECAMNFSTSHFGDQIA